MKKRCLAVLLAACVMAGSVLAPTEGNTVYAASAIETGVTQESEETVSATETESVDNQSTEDTEIAGAKSAETETEEGETESTETEEVDNQSTEDTEIADTQSTEVENTETSETEINIESTEVEVSEEAEMKASEEAEEPERRLPTGGLLPLKVMDVSDVQESDIYELKEESQLKQSAIYNHEWDKYSNNYYYNQMSDEERQFWDALDAMCLEYLNTNKNIEYDSSYKGYFSDYVISSKLSKQKVVDIFYIFRYANPQYYFLKASCLYGSYQDGRTVLAAEIYPSFANGSERAKATAAVKAQVDTWQAQIDTCSSDEEKVKLIHDLIIQKVDYNYPYIELPEEEQDIAEDTLYTQSAYSVFCTDLTICAGYSQAYGMMCNGSGIDCIAVTSYNHAWNKVRVNDSWYNVDCTWDDAGNSRPIYYDFFARNDAYYDNAEQADSHAEEAYLLMYLPLCTLDTASTAQVAGNFPKITETTKEPKIKVEVDGDGDQVVTLTSATSGADIFYTIDGVNPQVSATKGIKYSDIFYPEGVITVKAIAVCNGLWDSKVVSKEIKTSKKCTITFNGNGSTSGKMSKQTAYTNSTFTLKKNEFKRKGYNFAGWNTKANGKGKAYSNKQEIDNLKGSMTLYAQWTLPTYKITYKLNGGTNNKNNPATYKKTTKTITLKNPTKKGYTFKGWYSDKNFKNKVTTIKKGSTGNKTLYAKWEANKYTIKFDGNGSTSGKMSALTGCKYGKSYKLTANKFKKKGYTFVGWNTKKNGTGKSYKNKQSIKNLTSKKGGTVTLYAQWKK